MPNAAARPDTILSYNEIAEADADPDMPPCDVKQLLAPFDGALSAAFDQAERSRRAAAATFVCHSSAERDTCNGYMRPRPAALDR